MQLPNKPGFRPRTLAAAIGLALAASGAQAATFEVTSTANAGAGSLREAIDSANAQAGPHIIDFTQVSGQTLTLTSDLPPIEEDLTLQGSEVTLSGDDQYRCLAAGYADLDVSDMTITACAGTNVGGIRGGGGGGGPYNYRAGGGIFSYYGDVSLSNVTVSGNSTGGGEYDFGYGGGVAVVYASLSVSDGSVITGNEATYGGGIAHSGPQLLVQDSTISDNNANRGGGVINRPPGGIERGEMIGGSVFDNTVISGNTAGEGGGLNLVGDLTLIDTEVSGNSAAYVGGGLLSGPLSMGPTPVRGSVATLISGSAIVDNTAGLYDGGASLIAQFGLAMDNTTISGNSAETVGGLYLREGPYGAPVQFNGVTITGNAATDGPVGGMLASSEAETSQIAIGNSIIAGNSATEGDVDLSGGFGQPAASTQAADRGDDEGGWKPLISRRQSARSVWGVRSAANASKAALQDWDRGLPPPPGSGNATFEVTYSLIGAAPSVGTFTPDTVSAGLVGANPQLGGLGDNGGPTPSHLPAATGPGVNLIPSGENGCGTTFTVDQRGQPRPDATSGQCDLGSVEVAGVPATEALSVPVNHPFALGLLALGAGVLGFFGLGRARRRF
ncbi:MAG: choice-of-anchor Q domain-containing protein [Xanthomonadales bacterium]|nr:choice-of-anchor Q domain-containing protein [Xanthomonadales bacterium]